MQDEIKTIREQFLESGDFEDSTLELMEAATAGGMLGTNKASASNTASTPIKTPIGTIATAEGGVSAARGFKASGVHAGFREDPDRLDFALVLADEPCAAAATFTQNVFCAAPVTVSRAHLNGENHGTARALIINSGNANAATGSVGLAAAEKSAEIAAEAIGCEAGEVLVASTGVIGVHLPLEPFSVGVSAALRAISASQAETQEPQAAKQAGASVKEAAHSAARAIMTTDTVSKEAAVTFTVSAPEFAGKTFTVGGMAKGSGMIMPNMATMISVITTDAPVNSFYLREALREAVSSSFNKITVDCDTSTNDSCFIFASGAAAGAEDAAGAAGAAEVAAAGAEEAAGAAGAAEVAAAGAGADGASADAPSFTPGTPEYAQFTLALRAVCENLARQMAADGEGATRLVTVRVFGAANEADADKVARTIANSPLVKTAIFGHDCNWGRIAAAAGRSGAAFRQENVDIDIMGLPVCRGGLTVQFSEQEALKRFENSEITIDINLGAGSAHTRMWTCDFTHEYITINGDYRT